MPKAAMRGADGYTGGYLLVFEAAPLRSVERGRHHHSFRVMLTGEDLFERSKRPTPINGHGRAGDKGSQISAHPENGICNLLRLT